MRAQYTDKSVKGYAFGNFCTTLAKLLSKLLFLYCSNNIDNTKNPSQRQSLHALCFFFFSFIKDWSYFCCYCFGNYFLSVIVLVFVGFFFGGGVEGAQGEKEIYGHNDNEKRKTYGLLHQSVHLYILVLTSKIHTL